MIERDWNWGSSGEVIVSITEHTGAQLGEEPEGLQAMLFNDRACQNGDRLLPTPYVRVILRGGRCHQRVISFISRFPKVKTRGILLLWCLKRTQAVGKHSETLYAILKAGRRTLHFAGLCWYKKIGRKYPSGKKPQHTTWHLLHRVKCRP